MTLPDTRHAVGSWRPMSDGKKSYSSISAQRSPSNLFTIYVDGKEVAKGIRQKELAKKMREVLREYE